jgi:hypothetical protein
MKDMCVKSRFATALRLPSRVGCRLVAAGALCGPVFVTGAMAQVMPGTPAFDLSASQVAPTNTPGELPPLTSATAAPLPVLGGTSQLAGAPPVALAPAQALLQWGPITFRPHVLYTVSYGNGLQASPGQQVNTLINEIDPGILFQLGQHWTLDYTPTLRYYSSSQFQNSFDNRVALTGGTIYRDWTFGLSQSYASYSQPVVQTASQLDQEAFATALSATYRMSTALSLELAVNQSLQYQNQNQNVPGGQLSNWRSWSTMDWLDYQVEPTLGAAIGAGFEYDNVSVGSDMTAEQLQGRITWRVRTKLSFVLSGGVEDRQFLSSGVANSLTPVFSLTAQYQLFEHTTLSLSGGRTISPALFQSQITESTTLNAGLNQRILGKLNLNVSGAYGTTRYQNTVATPSPSIASNYETTSVNVSLSTAFLKRATAAVFYQLTYYSSGSAIYNYNTAQAGLSLGYRF